MGIAVLAKRKKEKRLSSKDNEIILREYVVYKYVAFNRITGS